MSSIRIVTVGRVERETLGVAIPVGRYVVSLQKHSSGGLLVSVVKGEPSGGNVCVLASAEAERLTDTLGAVLDGE